MTAEAPLDVFACPTCGADVADPTTPLAPVTPVAGAPPSRRVRRGGGVGGTAGIPTCAKCGTTFPSTAAYTDMTPAAARTPTVGAGAAGAAADAPTPRLLPSLVRSLTQPPKQGVFQSPLVSYLYERGWRANFAVAGSPGPAAEADAAIAWFLGAPVTDARRGRLVVDVSCGSGIVSRLLAASPAVGRLVAVDLSAAMLREAATRARSPAAGTVAATPRRRGGAAPPAVVDPVDFTRVRADVGSLPFRSASVDAVHAGAALHCWPVVQDGLAEAARVLVPGGRVVATTFLNRGGNAPGGRWAPSWLPAGSALYRFFGPDELTRLFTVAGFVDVTVEVLGWYAIVRAVKPE